MEINREHPEYMGRKGSWKTYRDLYAGGDRMQDNASEYLPRRHREPLDVYMERLGRVFYENYIGSIVDWYGATLFRREPILEFEGDDLRGKRFFSEFVDDCDRKGTALTDFLRARLIEALIGGTSYVLADFPRVTGLFDSRAAEDAAGRSRAYLVGHPVEDVINWSHDDDGNYEWVVLRTESLQKQSVDDKEWKRSTTWRYYDKQKYRIYRRSGTAYEGGPVEVIAEGTHGLAKQNRVPLFRLIELDNTPILNSGPYFQSKTLRMEACQIDMLVRTKKSLYVIELKLRAKIDHTCITDVQEKIRRLKLPKGTPCRTVLVYHGDLDPSIADEDFFDYLVPFERLFEA